MGAWWQNPARATAFDNSSNSFAATDVQAAIEEARDTAVERTAYVTAFGFDGTASTGRWLEGTGNVGSDESGYVVPAAASIIFVTASCHTNSTGTISVFKNGSSIGSVSFSSNQKITSTTSFSVAALDEISAQVTSGSIARPTIYLHFRLD